MIRPLQQALADALHLFYPHLCLHCNSDLIQKEHFFCLHCMNELPRTGFATQPDNAVEKMFWGRIPVHSAFSEFYFARDSIVQVMIHELKYRNNQKIGLY